MELRREALHLAEEFRAHNRTALLNLLSDSTTALTGFALLLRNSDGRGALFRTIGRLLSGFSDTAKAFLIIASTPRLMTASCHPASLQKWIGDAISVLILSLPQWTRTA